MFYPNFSKNIKRFRSDCRMFAYVDVEIYSKLCSKFNWLQLSSLFVISETSRMYHQLCNIILGLSAYASIHNI